MRLVKVTAPEGAADQVAQVAFAVGIPQVSIQQEQHQKPNEPRETKDVIDVATATNKARAFIDALMSAPFFDPREYSINVRQPRSIVSREQPKELTWPMMEPVTDIYEELWQFSQVTLSFVGRIFIAGALVAYGMIENKILFMIAGLLFIPFLPLLMAVSFGAVTREWRIVGQGAMAFIIGVGLLVAGGAAVGLALDRPISFNESSPLVASMIISSIIGIAAVLAIIDDVGKREMIGLAASAQIAIAPVWFGIAIATGYPSPSSVTASERALTFAVNAISVIIAAFCVFLALRISGKTARLIKE